MTFARAITLLIFATVVLTVLAFGLGFATA